MIVDRTPQDNAAVSFERPGLSFAQGRYNGYNPLFAGNQVAVGKAADWNWLSLYFSTMSSQMQAGGTLSGVFSTVTTSNLIMPSMTQGSALFVGAGGVITQSNPFFFFDNTNSRLGIGTNSPSVSLDVNGDIRDRNMTAGSVLFAGTGGVISQNNASFFWDNANLSLNLDASALAGNVAQRFRVIGDTQNRLQITGDGILGWGTGSAAIDVTLGRLAANPGVAVLTGAGAGLQAAFVLDNTTGTVRDYRFSTEGSLRWAIRANGTAESGSNAGSDLVILSRTDAGASLNAGVFFIKRSTGFIGINTTGPDRQLDILDATNPQLRLTTADGTTFTDFQDGSGILTISPSANSIVFSNGTKTSTSGTTIGLSYTETFADGGTNSTTVAQGLTLAPTINYSAATKTGRAYVEYMSPTATSLPTGLNGGLVLSSVFATSNFAGILAFNTSDELTNPQYYEQGWHITANAYSMRTNRLGTGTIRTLDMCYGGVATVAIRVPAAITSAIQIGLHGTKSTANTTVQIVGTGAGNITSTSGTQITLDIAENFAPSSTSTMAAYGLNWTPTINYSAGTPGAGYVYGIYLKPTNTALPTGISAAIALGSTANGINGIVWNNQTDEQTNYEQLRVSAQSSVWTFNSIKGGSGTLRPMQFQMASAATLTLGIANEVQVSQQANGQNVSIESLTELTTIAAAATTDTAIQIPVDAVVFAVSVRVTVAIPTAVTFTVTGTTSGTQFDVAGGVAVALNTTDVGTRNCPYKNGAAQTIRITPSAPPAANTGRVRVTIHYYKVTVPTS